MCGRYVTISKIKEIEKRFGVTAASPDDYQVNANVSPGQKSAVITDAHPDQLEFFTFGFTPFWATKRMYVINARSEGDHNKDDDPKYKGAKGIINKPMFRSSIRSKRCLVIADAFIEGPKTEKLSKPFCVYLQDGERPFAFAGIWDEWADQSTGELIHSFAIITTTAEGVLQKIGHHRSPVILDREGEGLWLDKNLPLAEATNLLNSSPEHRLNAYPISTDIKNSRMHGLELLRPIGERVLPEYTYELHQSLQLEGMGAAPARQRRLFDDDAN
ncbi:MAG: SOS response-associated peptidase [Cryomorphaceae bacterium]